MENVIEDTIGVSASETALDMIADYGKYAISTKLPSLIDGLKVVNRHILVTIGSSTENDKVNAIVGAVMSKHPHGDQSIGDALVRMAQPFRNTFPLVWIQGNVGSYSGEDPADGRYLDVQSSEFTRDVYFNGINFKTFTYVPSKTGKGMEPMFLIPKIPMALLTGAFGIAVGYSTYIPPLNFLNLCKFTKEFIKRRQSVKGMYKELEDVSQYLVPETFAPAALSHLIPDYPTPGIIRNAKALAVAYRKGDLSAPVVVDGLLTITPSAISLRALPPGDDIFSTYESVLLSMKDKDSAAAEWFQELRNRSTSRTVSKTGTVSMTTMEGDFTFILKRGIDPFTILSAFKQMIGFTKGKRPLIMGLDSTDSRQKVDPIQLIELWYQARCRSILSDLCYTQNDLIEEYRRLEAMVIINGHEQEITEIFRAAKTREEVIQILVQRFKLSYRQAEYIGHLQLNQLTREGREDLLAKQAEIKEKLAALKERFTKVDQQIIKDIEGLEKKYGSQAERKAKLSQFQGYVKVANGIIQYWDTEELLEIVDAWKTENVEIHRYLKPNTFCYLCNDESVVDNHEVDLPKDNACLEMITSPHRLTDTIVIRDNKLFRIKELIYKEEPKTKLTLVGSKCIMITKTGNIQIIPTSDIVLRRALSATGNTTDVVHVADCVSDNVIIVHANESESNVIRIQWAVDGDRLNRIPLGKIKVLGVYPVDSCPLLNVPKEILSRTNIYHIELPEATAYLTPGKMFRIYLNSKKTDLADWSIKKDKDTGMYTLVRAAAEA